MQISSLTVQQKNQTEEFLKKYSFNRKLLRLDKYEKEYFRFEPEAREDTELINEMPLAKAQMAEVKQFVLSLPNGDEKLFLYYHYIRGESVERCAELLNVARRTAFRMKKRALLLAYQRLSG